MTATAPEPAVHRADLCRTASFTLRAAADMPDDQTDDGLTIDGYAAVYGRDVADGTDPTPGDGWSLIDSWEGTFWERFVHGAFRKSLRERTPRMQFDHGRHPLLGSLPLGRWTDITEEADAGLHTVGRLSDNWLVEPFRDAIRDEAVDGMSIRFEVVREEWRDSTGRLIRDDAELLNLLYRPDPDLGPLRRTLREAKLPEAGPVTWPAYSTTSVGVRSSDGTSKVVIDLARLRDPAQRSILARAVYLADAATSGTPTPQPTTPAGLHLRDTASTTDTPRPTDAPSAPAGEHESADPKPMRNRPKDHIDRAREAADDRLFTDALAEVRAALATVKEQ